MIENDIIFPIFPDPILKTGLSDEVPKDVLDCAFENHKDLLWSTTNHLSENMNVIKGLSIEKQINKKLTEYVNTVYKPKNKISVYITESWFTYTHPGHWHHKHSHTNSFLSGVYYVNCNKNDSIIFFKEDKTLINIEATEQNDFNSRSWIVPVSNGDLVIFPSYIEHSVDKNAHEKNTRISLAFNTFIKGEINSKITVGLNIK